MLGHVRRNVVAYAAVFVALSGTSYAALKLPDNSVGTAQLRDGSVTSSKLAAGAVTGSKVKRGSLQGSAFNSKIASNRKGDQGESGTQGSAGSRGPSGLRGSPGVDGQPGVAASAFSDDAGAMPPPELTNDGGRTSSRRHSWRPRHPQRSHPDAPTAVTGVVQLMARPAAPDRVPGQLDAISHPQLLEDVRAVALDRLLADHQDLGDLLARVALGDQLDHLLLTRGERILRRRLTVARPREIISDDRRDRRRIEERLPPTSRSTRRLPLNRRLSGM